MRFSSVFFAAVAFYIATAEAAEVEGIENCPNKCDKVFARTQYQIADQPGSTTFENRACNIGCDQCAKELANVDLKDDKCFEFCKKYNYKQAGLRKGVIEPDKACIMGCMINTCQEVCWGGTTDQNITPQNSKFWWGQGGNGCSIKQGMGYVQNPDYVNPNSPGGQGGSETQRQCCANAFNLCEYVGPKTTTNFKNVQLLARRSCVSFVKSQKDADICTYYNNAQNCGTPGMGGTQAPTA